MMKKSYLLVVLLIVALSSSCKKIDELTQFTLSFDESLTIPAFPIVIEDPISYPYTIETNSEEEFAKYNTSPDRIEEVRLEEASLKISNSVVANFDFLKSIKFYLSAEGLDEVLIASKLNVEDGVGQLLELDIEVQDLSSYLKKEEIEIRVELATDQPVTEEFDMLIHTSFFVDAKILGI